MRHVFAAVLHGAAIAVRDTRCGDALIGATGHLHMIGTHRVPLRQSHTRGIGGRAPMRTHVARSVEAESTHSRYTHVVIHALEHEK